MGKNYAYNQLINTLRVAFERTYPQPLPPSVDGFFFNRKEYLRATNREDLQEYVTQYNRYTRNQQKYLATLDESLRTRLVTAIEDHRAHTAAYHSMQKQYQSEMNRWYIARDKWVEAELAKREQAKIDKSKAAWEARDPQHQQATLEGLTDAQHWRLNTNGNYVRIIAGNNATIYRYKKGGWGWAYNDAFSDTKYPSAMEAAQAFAQHLEDLSHKISLPDNVIPFPKAPKETK